MKVEITKSELTKPEPNTKLRKAREARGWTQALLAERVNAGLSTIRSWEDGRRPSVVYRARLTALFGMSLEELGIEDEEQTDGKGDSNEVSEEGMFVLSEQKATPLALETSDTSIIEIKTDGHPVVDKNRPRMIQRVLSRWITDMLEQISPQISLTLRLAPERIASPWKTRNQDLFASSPQEFSSAAIERIFDSANGELLILGDTGTGKTVLLVQLLQRLLDRCHHDATFPIPVIFNLSSWAIKKQTLGQWLVEQLQYSYQIPYLQALEWISDDHILPLLDGLDEVADPARAACVDAINDYRQEHGFLPLVVCCRSRDYEALPRLVLNQAIVVQSLTSSQIQTYIERGGEPLAVMQVALQNEPALQELLSTPLMLNICAHTAQDMPPEDFLAIQFSRPVLIEQYVERLLRKKIKHPYTLAETKKWLAWLAWNMEQHNLSEVYIERLQPSWIEHAPLRQNYQQTVVRIIIALQCLVSGALVAWLKGGLKNGVVGSGNGVLGLFGGGEGNSMLGWMSPGIGGGNQGGMSLVIILGIVIWLVTILVGSPALPTMTPKAIWYGVRKGGSAGIKLGVIAGILVIPLFSWRGGIEYGLTYGLGSGFLLGMLMGLMRGFATGLRYGQQPPSRSIKEAFASRLIDALIWGACGGVSFAVVEELLRVNQQSTIIYSPIVALFFFSAYGFGGGGNLFASLTKPAITPVESVTWSWSQMVRDIGQNALKSLLIALVVGSSVGLAITGITSFFFRDLSYGLHYGLVLGIICGLIGGMTGLLTTMLKSAWTGKMLPEDQYVQVNEGITRSAHNALIGACLFALAGGIASGLACAVGFGLIGQLSTWPVMALAFAVMLCIMLFVIFFTAHGGIPWVQHYILRLYLRRTDSIPSHYLRFLHSASEYALLRRGGGGYMFSHRQILEYFADLYPQKDEAYDASVGNRKEHI